MRTVKLFCALFIIAVIFNVFSYAAISAENGEQNAIRTVNIVLDNVALTFTEPPQLVDGRTLAPMNDFSEAMGITVKWDEETQTIILIRGDAVIILQVDNTILSVNGAAFSIDVPPMIINGDVFVPVRTVAESLTAMVDWDADTQTVYITFGENSSGANSAAGTASGATTGTTTEAATETSTDEPSSSENSGIITQIIDVDNENVVFATINAAEIKKYEFMYFYSSIKGDMLNSENLEPGSEAEESYLATQIDGATTIRDNLKQYAINELTKYKILQLLGDEIRTTSDINVREYIDQILSMSSFANEDELALYIARNFGLSLDAFVKVYAQTMINDEFYYELLDSMYVSDEDVYAEYEKNVDLLDTVTVRHILFLYNGESGDRSEEESLALAEDMLARIEAGEDMGALALDYSEDGAVYSNEGEYTFGRNDDFVPEFVDWGFSANPGDLGIIETDYGYHVMRLEASGVTPFDELEDDIIYWLKTEALNDYLNQFLVDPAYELIVDEAIFSTM